MPFTNSECRDTSSHLPLTPLRDRDDDDDDDDDDDAGGGGGDDCGDDD